MNAPSPSRRLQRSARRRRGFTLIEAALTGVIVGTGVLAMVSAQQAYHIKNNWALRAGTGQLLANEIRELMLNLRPFDPSQPGSVGVESNEGGAGPENVASWDDVDDFAGTLVGGAWTGVSFNPPINGLAQPVNDLAQWTQQVQVESVSPDNLPAGDQDPAARLPLGITSMLRVTCTVFYQRDAASPRETITSLQWLVPTF